MKSRKGRLKLIIALMLIVILFAAAALLASGAAKNRAEEAAEAKAAAGPVDYYSMQEFSGKNSEAVFRALKSGSSEALKKIMADKNAGGIDEVMDFADWSKADFDGAITMGSGSLTAEPDKKGMMDVSERFFVDIGSDRYMIFIETLTSGRGRKNEGVSAVSVTSFSHFDATDYAWNGEDDGESALAGELFWK